MDHRELAAELFLSDSNCGQNCMSHVSMEFLKRKTRNT